MSAPLSGTQQPVERKLDTFEMLIVQLALEYAAKSCNAFASSRLIELALAFQDAKEVTLKGGQS